MSFEYIKYRQRKLEKKWRLQEELEAREEEERVVKMEAEARRREEEAYRKRLLLEQQENERLRQKRILREEKLAEQKWDNQCDTLVAQVKERLRKDNKLEEIRIIGQNREPPLQALDWASWLLSDPLNQRLAELDLEQAMEMYKRDNLMAKRRSGTRGKKKKSQVNYALAFTGDTGASAADDYVTTDFNPDDYNLNLGFTVSYWVRADEVGNKMYAFGRKHSGNERFTFGIEKANQIFIGIGNSEMKGTWGGNLDDGPSGLTAAALFPDLFTQPPATASELKTGNWLHFAVTYVDRESTSEGSVARKVFLNGELIRNSTINWSSTGGSTGGMIFGGRRTDTATYNSGWACALNHVAIYDTRQSEAWVESIYNAGRTGTDHTDESGLVGYWKLNERSGTTITDHSGNGNHGTFAAISGDTTAYPTWEKI